MKNDNKTDAAVQSTGLAGVAGSGIVYGQSYFWTKPDGSTMTGFTYGHASKESALTAIRDILLPLGWTAPRWWQISRWSDMPRSFPNITVRHAEDGA